jgi:predicted nucleotidyltransferase
MNGAELESALRSFFAGAPRDVLAVYLYGSRARGTDTAASDVDIAVLYAAEPAPFLAELPLDLESDLERAIGLPVQAVVLNRAPADLIHRVLRDGKLLLDRERTCRIRFEVQARNDFFDLKPILDRYRDARALGR